MYSDMSSSPKYIYIYIYIDFLSTVDVIDVLCLVYSNFFSNKIQKKSSLTNVYPKSDFRYYFLCSNLNKLNIKYQSHPKSRKIEAFGKKFNMSLTQPYL